MNLPNNGKIIIIDDKESDVMPLLRALKKEKMPFLFFTDQGGDDLPDETPISNVRLVFLDLDLGIGDSSNKKQKVRIVQERLTRLIEKNNPYILAIWSTHEDSLLNLLIEDFEDKLKDYAPIVRCSFDKQDTLHNGHEDPIKIIREKLKSELGKFEAFNTFLFWESIVNKAAGNLVDEFTNFVPVDANWNNEVSYILYRLAKAYSGKQVDNADFTDKEKLKSSLFTLNQNLVDAIEHNINADIEEFDISSNLFNSPSGTNSFIPKVNTKLLLSEGDSSGLVPGSIFDPINELQLAIAELKDKLDKKVNNPKLPKDKKKDIIKKSKEKYEEDKKDLDKCIKSLNQGLKQLINDSLTEEGREHKDDILKQSIYLELNISPLCDYAQNKLPRCRLLPGALINKQHFDYLNKNSTYSYIGDVTIIYESISYYIVLDFRFLYSLASKEVKHRKAIFKLKHHLLADIQLKLGNHVNRAGVLYA